jgi:hypothetical protein
MGDSKREARSTAEAEALRGAEQHYKLLEKRSSQDAMRRDHDVPAAARAAEPAAAAPKANGDAAKAERADAAAEHAAEARAEATLRDLDAELRDAARDDPAAAADDEPPARAAGALDADADAADDGVDSGEGDEDEEAEGTEVDDDEREEGARPRRRASAHQPVAPLTCRARAFLSGSPLPRAPILPPSLPPRADIEFLRQLAILEEGEGEDGEEAWYAARAPALARCAI